MRMSSKIFRTEKENGQYRRTHEPSLCNIHTQELTFTKSLSEHTRSLPSPPSSSSTPPPTPCSCWPTTNVGAALGLSVPDPVDFRTCVTTVQKTTNENNHLNLLSQVWIKPKQTNRQTDTSLSCLTTGVFVYVQSIVRVRACVLPFLPLAPSLNSMSNKRPDLVLNVAQQKQRVVGFPPKVNKHYHLLRHSFEDGRHRRRKKNNFATKNITFDQRWRRTAKVRQLARDFLS